MTSRGDPVGFTILIHIDAEHTGSPRFIHCQYRFGPWLAHFAAARVCPECEPVTLLKRSSLGAHGNLHPPIPVDIAQAHVMTASPRIAAGKDMSIPGIGRVGVLGNTQPGDGVRDASCRFKIVDDDIVPAVLVHIRR